MSSYKTSQEVIVYRNRRFHFVSYEGHRADPRGQKPETPDGWFLMVSGKRHKVIDQVAGLERAELLQQLILWLEGNVFAGDASPAIGSPESPAPRSPRRRR